jgi:hypothetical protein
MKRLVLAVCLLALVIPVAALAQTTAVSVLRMDKSADFSKIKTYEWTPGQKALDPAWDKAIIAAIDKELAARGIKKGAPGDILVAYHAVQRADVDLSTFDQKAAAQGGAAAQVVKKGTLAIDLRNPSTRTVIWRVAGEGAIKEMPDAERDAFLAKMVAALFEKYPATK